MVRVSDAQIHIWSVVKDDYDPKLIHRPTPLTADEVVREMDAAGVERAVVIPPAWGALGPDGNEYALDSARRFPDRLGVVGFLNLDASDAEDQLLGAKERGMRGMRVVFMPHLYRAHLDDGRADWVWESAESAGLPLMIAGALDRLGDVAAAHPNLRVATQMNWPARGSEAEIEERIAVLTRLAERPNISIKAKMLPNLVPNDVYPYKSAHDNFRRLVDAYGPARVFWGSDLSHLRGTYRELVTMFTEGMPWLDDHSLRLIMGESLNSWLSWP